MNPSGGSGVKKLKRGLQDLSSLFQDPAPQTLLCRPPLQALFEVQFLTVCVPDHEGDAFLANAFFASELVRQVNLAASLVSITPGHHRSPLRASEPFPSLELLNSKISRLVLSHQSLWSFTESKGPLPEGRLSVAEGATSLPSLIFLDFEPSQFRSLARIARLLDRMVLFSPADGDSLQEAYRMMKIFWHLNREIEFFLLFRGPSSSPREREFFFERFSLITSRFLGLSPAWLGGLAFPEKRERSWVSQEDPLDFNPAPVLSSEGLARPLSPEKRLFWSWFQNTFQGREPRGLHV